MFFSRHGVLITLPSCHHAIIIFPFTTPTNINQHQSTHSWTPMFPSTGYQIFMRPLGRPVVPEVNSTYISSVRRPDLPATQKRMSQWDGKGSGTMFFKFFTRIYPLFCSFSLQFWGMGLKVDHFSLREDPAEKRRTGQFWGW